MSHTRRWLLLAVLLTCALPSSAQTVLYQTDAYTLTDRSVEQGDMEAVADSRTQIRSNYLYDSARTPRRLAFKFALNGQDNEAVPGRDHSLYLAPRDGRIVTPIYTFGTIEPAAEAPALSYPLRDPFEVTFRLDLSPMLQAFEADGVYTPPAGAPIREEDFEGVYIAGSEQPLTWDFNAFVEDHRLQDPDGDGIYQATLTFFPPSGRPFDEEGYAVWSLGAAEAGSIQTYPQLTSDQVLVDALYALSLEELRQLVRPEGVFRTGAKWPGVWTRDISYSILLSLALLEPEVARASLLAKTRNGMIVQDTGTGGSWPVSSDRVVWAMAAWEVYLVTGDEAWLRQSYDIIRRTAAVDLQTVRDGSTGLFYGESSFLDWREQTYPRWMDPRDIYRSQALGTNAAFYACYQILVQMADRLGEPTEAYLEVANSIRHGMNTYLWNPDTGTYGQYRYGRQALSLSPRAEALGASLAVLLKIASRERQQALLDNQPLTTFGVPSIYPQIPGIPPYHNDGIWPFVVAFWTWAGASGGHSAAVEHGLASQYRAAALFLTNKENMVASDGHFEGTQINSDRQLWSVAGLLSSVYRVLFGLQLESDRLTFSPFVPEAYQGTRTLTNLRYRDATLTVTVEGFGDTIDEVLLDGTPVDRAEIPATLSGAHTLVIRLSNTLPDRTANIVDNRFTPDTPVARWSADELTWVAVEEAVVYEVHRNGRLTGVTTSTRHAAPATGHLAEYQVRTVDQRGLASFLSEPVRVVADTSVHVVQPSGAAGQAYAGFTGPGYVPLTRLSGDLTVEVRIDTPGLYSLDARYANGSGPVNTDNKGALRSLFLNDERVGPLVMPQRGTDNWDDWGYTNPLELHLPAGTHTLTLSLTSSDENMNGEVNTALLDHLRLTRIAP